MTKLTLMTITTTLTYDSTFGFRIKSEWQDMDIVSSYGLNHPTPDQFGKHATEAVVKFQQSAVSRLEHQGNA